MIRKTIIGLSAAIGLALGMTALTGEASASHRTGFGVVIHLGTHHGHGYRPIYYRRGHVHRHCHRIRHHGRRARVCHVHRHRYGHHG